ncbi:MAG: RHS repeat-associated core domain-containing protein [Bacteroidales bacterium]|nr:RHS repeat-associated core domain-containing protein [Bacteroidales bacterium]
MMNLLICLSLFLTASALPLLPGETIDIGEYSSAFHYSSEITADYYLFTITDTMDVTVNTFEPAGKYGTNTFADMCTLLSYPDREIISQTIGSGDREYAYNPLRIGIEYPDLPPGSYLIQIMSEGGEFSIAGCERNPYPGHKGEDYSMAYQLGSHDSSYSYSLILNMENPRMNSYGDIPNDVFFHITLDVPAYTVIDQWGSKLGIPDNAYALSRLYIVKVTKGLGSSAPATLTRIASAAGSEDLKDSLKYLPDAVHGVENYNPQLACWKGWLDAGEYYFISEGAYSQGASVTKIYNGMLRTNINCIIPEGETERIAIDTDIDDLAEFEYTDSRDASWYRDGTVYYTFTLTHSQDIKLSTTGKSINLKDSSGKYVDFMPDSKIREYMDLSPGRYIVVTGFTEKSSVPVTTTIESADFSREGNSLDNPIDAGRAEGEYLFCDIRNMRYYKTGNFYSEVTYGLSLDSDVFAVFSNGGCAASDITGYLRRKSDHVIVATATPDDSNPYISLEISAGEYLYTVRCRDISALLATKIECYGRQSSLPAPRPTSSMNYVMSITPQVKGVAADNMMDSDAVVEVSYFDMMGRPLETVVRGGALSVTDCAGFVEYEYGLPVKDWTNGPVPGCSGEYVALPGLRQASYGTNLLDTAAYSATVYDSTYMRRPVKSYGPGQRWYIEDKYSGTEYLVNEVSGDYSCPSLVISGDSEGMHGLFLFAVAADGNFPAGELSVVENTDEDGRRTLVFTDKQGHDVLVRQMDGSSKVDTYYLYDGIGNLRCVVQPMGMSGIPESGDVPSDILQNYCWVYSYDSKGRLVSYFAPDSQGYNRIVYNRSGYPLLKQSPEQMKRSEWSASLLDALGREAVSGLVMMTDSQAYLLMDSDISVQYSGTGDIRCEYDIPSAFAGMDIMQVNYYDDYSCLGDAPDYFAYAPCPESDPVRTKPCTGLLTASVCHDLGTGKVLFSAYYYDHYGNLCQTRADNVMRGKSLTCFRHDFTGNVLSMKEEHGDSLSNVHYASHEYRYDHLGRQIADDFVLDGVVSVPIRSGYDAQGNQSLSEVYGHGDIAGLPSRTYRRFNVRGWQQSSENDAFSYNLYYDAPSIPDAKPLYAGNITQWSWRHSGDDVENSYILDYDNLGRFSGVFLYENGDYVLGKNSESVTYDLNGNLRSLRRWSDDGVLTAEYAYGYNAGNRMSTILLVPVAPYPRAHFSYDSNGNMTVDGLHGLSLGYNYLNLVDEVRDSGNDSLLVRYSYLPDGTRTGSYYGASSGQIYVGSMIYDKSEAGYSLGSVAFAGGRVNDSLDVHLHVTDHLGSVRAVVDGKSGKILERDDYYPFGMRWASSSPTLQSNLWRYNGKELQTFAGIPYIDYGARMYDYDTGRWFVPDPLAENYYSVSPYAFCSGNPVNFVDLDGEKTYPLLPFTKSIGLSLMTASKNTWKELGFAIAFPNAAAAIAVYDERLNLLPHNMMPISMAAGNFTINFRNATGTSLGEGSESNAFRHTLWQAMITSNFDASIAFLAGISHENNNSIDFSQQSFMLLNDADRAVDLLNNTIGQYIGTQNKGNTNKDLASKVLDFYFTEGLWVVRKSDDRYIIERQTLNEEQYRNAVEELMKADNSGLREK